VRRRTLQHATMAYPPSYYPIKNLTQFRSGNWTWAPPGDRGNVCDYCGTHCFCDAKKGLLPRKRGAVVGVAGVVYPAVAHAAVLHIHAAAPAVVDAAAPVAAVAAVVEDVAPAVVDEGILALLAYEDSSTA